jgi:DNA-binding MurR/RpiR family transcriptional regulator
MMDDLNRVGRRVKTHDQQLVVKLPAAAKALIREIGEKEGVSDATIVRMALAEWMTKRGYKK